MEGFNKWLFKEGKQTRHQFRIIAIVSSVRPIWFELKQAEAWESFVGKKGVFWLQLQTGRQANKECI